MTTGTAHMTTNRGIMMPAIRQTAPDENEALIRAEQQLADFRPPIEKPRVRVPAGRRVMEGRPNA